jgi:N-acetylmuramoyl-L-alanine amidase
MEIQWIGCAPGNFAKGRSGGKPEAIVIHLMDGSLTGTDAWFLTERAVASSAHYGVGKNGEVHQYVLDEDRAYHAGRMSGSTWSGIAAHPGVNPNAYTIGIEHEGRPEDVWSEAMIAASAALIRQLADKWGIPLDREHICGHHEIFAPKVCPGPNCDLDKLIEMAADIFPNASKVS